MIWDILISGGIPSRIRGGGGATNLTDISPNSRMIFHWPCHAFQPTLFWTLNSSIVTVAIKYYRCQCIYRILVFPIFSFFFSSRMSIATIQWLLLLSIIGVTLWQCIYRLLDITIVCQQRGMGQNIYVIANYHISFTHQNWKYESELKGLCFIISLQMKQIVLRVHS